MALAVGLVPPFGFPNAGQTRPRTVPIMTERSEDFDPGAGTDEPRCDCGYRSQGSTIEQRVRDAQHHARSVHGIDVTPDQVLVHGEGNSEGDGQ